MSLYCADPEGEGQRVQNPFSLGKLQMAIGFLGNAGTDLPPPPPREGQIASRGKYILPSGTYFHLRKIWLIKPYEIVCFELLRKEAN